MIHFSEYIYLANIKTQFFTLVAFKNTVCPHTQEGVVLEGVVLPRLSRPPHTGGGGFAEVVEAPPHRRGWFCRGCREIRTFSMLHIHGIHGACMACFL